MDFIITFCPWCYSSEKKTGLADFYTCLSCSFAPITLWKSPNDALGCKQDHDGVCCISTDFEKTTVTCVNNMSVKQSVAIMLCKLSFDK